MIPLNVYHAFGLNPEGFQAELLSVGHINQTIKITAKSGPSYIVQRLNTSIFKKPEAIEQNLITASKKLSESGLTDLLPNYLLNDSQQIHLQLNPSEVWRVCRFVENTRTLHVPQQEDQAFAAAEAFAILSRILSSDVDHYQDTITDFHNLKLRIDRFYRVLENTPGARIAQAQEAIEGYKELEFISEKVAQLKLPIRITHNDTKITNVLFDSDSSTVKTVIDPDTIMPGLVVNDLGDMLRTYTPTLDENSWNWHSLKVRKSFQEATIAGFIQGWGGELTHEERVALPLAGPFMCYLIGLRFLTDFLEGNVYFKVSNPLHNLHRAHNQLVLTRIFLE